MNLIASPTLVKSKRTRRKSIMKTTKRRRANEKSRHVPKRQEAHPSTRDMDHLVNMDDKENHQNNNGFTQLIQTKMMETKKRQGHQKNKKTNDQNNDDQRSTSVTRKRPRPDHEESPDVVLAVNDTETSRPDPPPNATDDLANGGTTTAMCHPRCDTKDHHLVPANKRRRACLCSKRQLYELEFAPDSAPSQTQQEQQQSSQREEEQQPPQEESHLESVLPLIHSSPPPLLLLPNSPLMPPSTSRFPLLPIPSISMIEPEEEEQEKNQSNVPSIIAAPLSPAMPLNSTYIAHRSVPIVTQAPPTFLGLSTLTSNETSCRLSLSTVLTTNIDQQRSVHSTTLAPITSSTNRHDQETSMTPTADQTIQCSVSTQTSDDDHYPTHHYCNDVSVCPCVQIYTRSEQLFMASMAIFFRNSITIAPQESPLTSMNNPIRKNNKPQSTPTNSDNDKTNPEIRPSSPVLIGTSTVIDETRQDHTEKSDGSSIQININSREESHEKTQEENRLAKSSNDQEKFKSLVLTMTALNNEQKTIFHRFVEHFSVRSSVSIDDSTTHLITDEDGENSLICPLTGKVLQAVARHLTIVSYRWLSACLIEQRYVDEIPTYEIIGDAIYNQHYGMSRSRINHSQNNRLLGNYAFHLKCHGCQPFIDNRPLIELIHLSGGLILKTFNQPMENTERKIVILCSKNYLQNKLALEQACRKLNILCLEPEWLIASIIKFEIQPYEPWLCTLFS